MGKIYGFFIHQARLDLLNPIELSQFLHSMAMVGYQCDWITGVILRRITNRIDIINAECTVAVLDSMALLGYYDQVSADIRRAFQT